MSTRGASLAALKAFSLIHLLYKGRTGRIDEASDFFEVIRPLMGFVVPTSNMLARFRRLRRPALARRRAHHFTNRTNNELRLVDVNMVTSAG